MGNRFTNAGRTFSPTTGQRSPRGAGRKRVVVTQAYCPDGCSIISDEHLINGHPGLHFKFSRPGVQGEFVLSALEADLGKVILSGELEDGVKDDLFCPHCSVAFKKITVCDCGMGEMVAVGLTPELDFNNAIAFCNVTGCMNSITTQAERVLLQAWRESF